MTPAKGSISAVVNSAAVMADRYRSATVTIRLGKTKEAGDAVYAPADGSSPASEGRAPTTLTCRGSSRDRLVESSRFDADSLTSGECRRPRVPRSRGLPRPRRSRSGERRDDEDRRSARLWTKYK